MRSWDDKAVFGPGGFRQPGQKSVVPDEHYAAIGKIADVWADLEFSVDRVIWDVLGEEQSLYACVTAQLISILPKLDALIALSEKLGANPKTLKSLKAFQGSIGSLVKQRNRVIHDHRIIWFGKGEVARFEVSAKGTAVFAPITETIDELSALRIKIDDKISEFRLIWDDLSSELGPLQDRPRVRVLRTRSRKGSQPTHPSDSK